MILVVSEEKVSHYKNFFQNIFLEPVCLGEPIKKTSLDTLMPWGI